MKVGLHPYEKVSAPIRLLRNNSYKDYTWNQYHIDKLHKLGYKGKGVKIAVIDTGAAAHYDIPESSYLHIQDMRYKARRGGINNPFDDDGHSTWIEGRLVGTKTGICPDAKIASLKALTQGTGTIGDIIAALHKAYELDVHLVNLSIGLNHYDKKLHEAIIKLYEKGVIVVCSAGNDGKLDDTDYPARFAEVISVGSHDNKMKIAKHSDFGYKLDCYDAGENVLSTSYDLDRQEEDYAYMTGTSMACPTTVGKLAILKEFFHENDIPFTLDNIKNKFICQKLLMKEIA